MLHLEGGIPTLELQCMSPANPPISLEAYFDLEVRQPGSSILASSSKAVPYYETFIRHRLRGLACCSASCSTSLNQQVLGSFEQHSHFTNLTSSVA